MRFTHQALHGLGDAQQNFEQLESLAILDKLPTSFLQLPSAKTQYVQFGHVAAVNSDGGGWCNYTLPTAFPTACDGVLAQNGFGGTSGSAFSDVQPVDASHFRAFITGAGLNADAYFVAWGH